MQLHWSWVIPSLDSVFYYTMWCRSVVIISISPLTCSEVEIYLLHNTVLNSKYEIFFFWTFVTFFFSFFKLIIYFWLCWVSVSVRGLSLVGGRAGSVGVAHGPSCSGACGHVGMSAGSFFSFGILVSLSHMVRLWVRTYRVTFNLNQRTK